MSVFPDQYTSQLPVQARAALFEWNSKNGVEDEEDGLKGEELTKEELAEKIADKVRRVMKVQFPAEGEHLAALPDKTSIIECFDEANHVRE